MSREHPTFLRKFHWWLNEQTWWVHDLISFACFCLFIGLLRATCWLLATLFRIFGWIN